MMKMIYIHLLIVVWDLTMDLLDLFNSGHSLALKCASGESFNNNCDQGDPRELKLITKIQTFSLETFKDLLE